MSEEKKVSELFVLCMVQSSFWICFIYVKKISKDDAGHFSIMAFIRNYKIFENTFRVHEPNKTDDNEILRVVKTCKCL